MSQPTKQRRRPTAEPAGQAATRVLAPFFAARGFPAASILADWAHIAGPDLAAYTTPDRLVWPRTEDNPGASRHRRLEGGTLTIRVAGPRAIEVQHDSVRILERLNLHFGWRAITSLKIIQGPARPQKIQPARRAPVPPLDAEASPVLRAIAAPDLRAALSRLGGYVKSA